MSSKEIFENNDEPQRTTIDDFIVKQGVKAFVKAYAPSSEKMATEIFNISRLRDFFQAWPNNTLGDPLVIYLDSLEANGFELKASFNGQLAIFVTNREVASVTL